MFTSFMSMFSKRGYMYNNGTLTTLVYEQLYVDMVHLQMVFLDLNVQHLSSFTDKLSMKTHSPFKQIQGPSFHIRRCAAAYHLWL